MKALSVRQPWADCIIHHGKDIENRDWRTTFRGRIYIHAAKKWGPDERETQADLATHFDWQGMGQPLLGGIIGTVEVVDCVKESDSWWFQGKFGFVLRDPQPLEFFPCKGALGFFTPNLSENQIEKITIPAQGFFELSNAPPIHQHRPAPPVTDVNKRAVAAARHKPAQVTLKAAPWEKDQPHER